MLCGSMAQGTEPARRWAAWAQERAGSPCGRGTVLPSGAGRPGKQAEEGGAALGMRGKLGHVRHAVKQAPVAARRPSKLSSRSAASRPASSESKARNTRGKASKLPATRSMPWVPRAATAGKPHWVMASQSNTPSVRTTQDVAAPSRPSPSTGLGPGSAWNLGDRSGSMARPTSQRTRPEARSGTTAIPANRSPRSVNRPEARIRSPPNPAASRYRRSPSPVRSQDPGGRRCRS